MIDRVELFAAFADLAPGATARLFRAPGRVNLIGEHTDYNEGWVLPVAIERATLVAAARRRDRRVRVRSLNAGETFEFDLDAPSGGRRGLWVDYVEGVAVAVEASGHRLRGADLVLASDVPEGAGLSSSAALEVATGLALAEVADSGIDLPTLALAAQRAEHEYVGTQCGIMDQYVSALAEAGHALLIDCRSLETKAIRLDFPDAEIVVCDSGVKHSLASSEYNVRRAECARGVDLLAEALPGIRALRDVGVEDFVRFQALLPEVIRRRCRHVVGENARTLDAAAALERGDLDGVGRLMYASHRSLRDDYQVSCAELDVLVDAAAGVDGVWGARMTGGGFGGSTVNLVRKDRVEVFRETVSRAYERAAGLRARVYATAAGAGASELSV